MINKWLMDYVKLHYKNNIIENRKTKFKKLKLMFKKQEPMLLSNELVSVVPHSKPIGILYYVHYKYEDILEIRRKKLDKILEKTNKNENLDN